MKIGLFFGSFNPIHIGHLIVANTIYENTDCREIWFVVSPKNPLKRASSLAHEHDRYDLVQAAISDQYQFRSCDIEFRMPRPSYTIDTLSYLSEKHPEKEFVLIIGSDNLQNFHKWKNYEMILEHYGLLVYLRPGQETSPLLNHANVQVVEAPLLNISASFIRQQIAAGKSVNYLLPNEVITIIKQRHLYEN